MLMNFSPLGLMNKPTYQTLDEVEIAKQIKCITVTWTETWGVCTTLKLLHPVCVMQEREEVE